MRFFRYVCYFKSYIRANRFYNEISIVELANNNPLMIKPVPDLDFIINGNTKCLIVNRYSMGLATWSSYIDK
jgi:hypothetical protein